MLWSSRGPSGALQVQLEMGCAENPRGWDRLPSSSPSTGDPSQEESVSWRGCKMQRLPQFIVFNLDPTGSLSNLGPSDSVSRAGS